MGDLPPDVSARVRQLTARSVAPSGGSFTSTQPNAVNGRPSLGAPTTSSDSRVPSLFAPIPSSDPRTSTRNSGAVGAGFAGVGASTLAVVAGVILVAWLVIRSG